MSGFLGSFQALLLEGRLLMLLTLRESLRQAADPVKAAGMQAYMKSAMPYHGVQTPLLRKVLKETFAEVEFAAASDWQGLVLELWRGARFREERYAALYLAALPMYEELIVTGAWWDYVDNIATQRIGPILSEYPGPMRRKMLVWSRSKDMWKRRTAILCQLGFKAETDLDLLYTCIEPSLESREFFLQKAIGWALRQYAWTDSAEIRRYVERNRTRMSALSCREALKNIQR